MLGHLILTAFLQLSGPAASPAEPTAKPPEMVCKTVRVTGSMVRKQEICKPKTGVDPEADRAQDRLRQWERGGSIVQSKPPGGSN